MAHSFVSSFTSTEDLRIREMAGADGAPVDLWASAAELQSRIVALLPGVVGAEVNGGELAAFVAYAIAFPTQFLALVDTYDVLKSGLINFCAVALALEKCGHRALGLRIDSGDLAWMSKESRAILEAVGRKMEAPWLPKVSIVASNDINEDTIYSLGEQGHSIDAFGVGTHLVTCQKQPALGCVFKLVSINGRPRIKLSQEVGKITIPGAKVAYRLYGRSGHAINDVLLLKEESPPEPGKPLLCRHPFQESKRAYVTPSRVERLHRLYWENGQIRQPLPSLKDIRANVQNSLGTLRSDHKRNLNPTPYKVSLSERLYSFLHELWLGNAPIGQLE